MQYNNNMPYYRNNMQHFKPYPPFNMKQNDRFGGFLLPFALGFVSSPLIFGATRPRPYPYYPAPGYFPYY